MSNGDDAMTSAEFAKLMGAYPEPAGNPSPAYGGFMDNSAANFSWVQNNDYFGAEGHEGMFLVKDIEWDTDDEDVDLPTSVWIPNEFYGDGGEPADWLSDNYGFLVIGGYADIDTIDATILGAESDGDLCDACLKDKPIVAFINLEPADPFPPLLCKECYAEHLEMGGKAELIDSYSAEDDKDYINSELEMMMDEALGIKGENYLWSGVTFAEDGAYFDLNAGPGGLYLAHPLRKKIDDFMESCGYPPSPYKGEFPSPYYYFFDNPSKDAESFNADLFHRMSMDMPEEMYSSLHDYKKGERYNVHFDSGKIVRVDDEYYIVIKAKEQMGIKNVYYKNFDFTLGPYPYTAKGWFNGYMKWKNVPMRGRDWATEVQEALGDFTDGYRPTAWNKGKGAESFNAESKKDSMQNYIERENGSITLFTRNEGRKDFRNQKEYMEWYDEWIKQFGAESFNAEAVENEIGCDKCGRFAKLWSYATLDVDLCAICSKKEGFRAESFSADGKRPQGMTSTRFRHKETGEIATRIPISEMRKWEKLDAETEYHGLSAEEYYAELNEFYADMEELTDGVSAIKNRFGDSVGMVQVDDEDLEDVSVEITDTDGGVVYEGILADEVPEREEDYYLAEMKKPSLLALALGVGAVLLGGSLLKDKLVKNADSDPELIESPNMGDLSPAEYEELVVESTGYAVDIIPMSLDGAFMGSRFAALPTERYVEYNDPGIGAHTDIALTRNENFLEPEMAMVQAAEGKNVIKETQAPGQSPYLSMDGQEPKDFNYRVLKETHPVSLDPAVVPFIPQSMAGYTGNDNRPPSVYNKMFNLGVLGQTPLFVPVNNDDIGSSHTGSRRATPTKMGNIGGPLSDAVNASYTDGQTSKSLAQWSIENQVQQTSDTEAMVIDRSSGNTKRIRRV